MIRSLFGSETTVGLLRTSLNDLSAQHRRLADRIANLRTQPQDGGFAATLEQQIADGESVEADISHEMVSLTSGAGRYGATAVLLQRTYQQFRTAIRNA